MGSFIVRRIFEGLLLCLEAHYFEGVFSRRSEHRQSGADFLKGLHLPFFLINAILLGLYSLVTLLFYGFLG